MFPLYSNVKREHSANNHDDDDDSKALMNYETNGLLHIFVESVRGWRQEKLFFSDIEPQFHSIFHSAIEEWKNVSCFSFRLIGLCKAKYHKSLGKINKEMDVWYDFTNLFLLGQQKGISYYALSACFCFRRRKYYIVN